jgi:excisionase family DNA binding protein
MTPKSGFLSPRSVAREADVDQQTVYRWVRTGRLRATKIGRLVRVSRADFDAFMSDR